MDQNSIIKRSSAREHNNWKIQLLYVRQDHAECLTAIEEQLKECGGLCEYPLYVKALIRRQQGHIQESLNLFNAATGLNPGNVANLKQVGHSLYLLGKHKQAIDVYEEARRVMREAAEAKGESARKADGDWETWHNMGLCYMYLKQYDRAIECFTRANSIQRHDATYVQLGKLHQLKQDYQEALRVYTDALDFSPENPELLTTMGLVYLRLDESERAFEFLGNALTHDPRSPRAILAAGSIIQDNADMDVALVKYRVAAVQQPNSCQLWNNIGMCLFGKSKNVAAVACLKRALYLDPFEWIISYNLGLVNLNTGQNASAFHYFSASINLKPDFAASYMYLAVGLARLGDLDNACAAYEKALSMEPDHMTHLNYAITLHNAGEMERARDQLACFDKVMVTMDEYEPEDDVEGRAAELRRELMEA